MIDVYWCDVVENMLELKCAVCKKICIFASSKKVT